MSRPRLRLAGAALVLAAGLVLAATAAGGDESPEREKVVATGASTVGGAWRMAVYESEQSAAQPAGLPCVLLSLDAPPVGSPIRSSGFCGELEGHFGAISLPVVNGDGDAEVLIAGRAPSSAATVELTGIGRAPVSVRTQDGGALPGGEHVFVLIAGAGWEATELIARDASGHAAPKRIDADGFFDRLEALTRAPP